MLCLSWAWFPRQHVAWGDLVMRLTHFCKQERSWPKADCFQAHWLPPVLVANDAARNLGLNELSTIPSDLLEGMGDLEIM